ncbi:MAG TPA: 2OG-Fe(II) oxygenase, partial [Caulobacteraceae bacterium]|nr:2OG-Fe(II) oxygenase [Caulobacteraceae bacterium]
MSPFLSMMKPGGFLDPEDVRTVGRDLRETYASARPFPHIVIDDFLPADIAESCLTQFPSSADCADRQFTRAQEFLKTQFNPDALTPALRTLFYCFNAFPFLKVMENITGIRSLVPDPYFLGAGFHEIGQGGYLGMHADFNHHKPMNLERRINALIYLNKDWKPEYGGQLELWDEDMKTCVESVVPLFNRCVIFNTTSGSWHGNPTPVNHPNGVTRKSIALYYYTATWSDERRDHTTQFRVRKGSGDKADWSTR